MDREIGDRPGIGVGLDGVWKLGDRPGIGVVTDGELGLGDRPGIGVDGVFVPDPGLGLAWVMDGAICDGNDGIRPSFAGFLGFEAVEDFLHRPVGGGVADAVKDLAAADRRGRHH